VHGEESPWSDPLPITMPKNKVIKSIESNTVVLDSSNIFEINEAGDVIWEVSVNLKIPMDVEILRNGNLLISDYKFGATGRVFEIDRENNLVWSHEDSYITDIEVFPNGDIAYLDMDYDYTEINILDGENHNLKYSHRFPDTSGNIRVGVIEILSNRNILAIDYNSDRIIEWDVTSNYVAWEYECDNLGQIKILPTGNILVCCVSNEEYKLMEITRANDVLWELELSDFKLVSDLEYLENGNILLSENEDSNWQTANRIVEIDTEGNILWEYARSNETYAIYDIERDCTFNNNPPNKPTTPSGPTKGKPHTTYAFTTSTTDPDGDAIFYLWDWGDGSISDWFETNEALHLWTTEDVFEVRVKAKDVYGYESEWSDPLAISMPKNKAINSLFLFLERLIERFPILEQTLQTIYDKLTGFY